MATAGMTSRSAPVRVAGFATPSPRSKRPGKSKKNAQEEAEVKRALLENLEMEVAHRMAAFRRHLSTSLSAFLLHQETELARIPADLKRMTIDELDAKWGGGWAGTMLRLTEERRAEAVQRDREAEERLREEANGQRKRGRVVSDSSPQRNVKNARKENTPLKGRLGIPSSTSKRKPVKKAVPFISATPGKKGPSTLPQNFAFNPILPDTPLRKMNPSDMLYTVNGSPVANPLNKSQSAISQPSRPTARTALRQTVAEEDDAAANDDDSDSDAGSDEDDSAEGEDEDEDGNDDDDDDNDGDSGDELVDPEAYARKLEAEAQARANGQSGAGSGSRSARQVGPNSSGVAPSATSQKLGAKPKRKPSLVWRQSMAGGHLPPPSPSSLTSAGSQSSADRVIIRLDNGDELDFDPFNLDKHMLFAQFEKLGVSADMRSGVERMVRDKVVEAELKRRDW